MLRRLENQVRPYAWGSRTHIARMTGLDLGGEKAAEMWLGAHPGSPSLVEGGEPLHEVLAHDAARTLGGDVREAFGDRLPYLMKLLAAAEPLSLQVHPTAERARRRHDEQEAAGIPLGAPERSYQDRSHKPELIYALTRFEGMAGFRDPCRSALILRGLGLPWLDGIADRLERERDALRPVVTDLLAMPGDEVALRLSELQVAASMAESAAHRPPSRSRPESVAPDAVERESIRVYAAAVPLVDAYPEDPGVLVTLLLNHLVLAPGEAMFLDAGTVHAYTSGFGVEIMASSDNVVRAGLTPKHVDVDELLAITDFAPVAPPVLAPSIDEDGVRVFRPPVEEFELAVHDLRDASVRLPAAPQVLLCLVGAVDVVGHDAELRLERGQSVFVDAAERDVELAGTGRVAIARTPT